MLAMSKEPNAISPQNEQSGGIASRLLRVLAYPIAAISGYWAADVSAHNSAYNTAKSLGAFDDILAVSTPRSRLEIQELITDKIATKEFWSKALASKSEYQIKADERMYKMGLRGFRSKWDYMAKANRQDAILVGMTVAGIAIGALLTMAESKAINNLFGSDDRQR